MFDPKPVDQYADEDLFTVFDEVVQTAKTMKATIQNPAELGVAISTAYQYLAMVVAEMDKRGLPHDRIQKKIDEWKKDA